LEEVFKKYDFDWVIHFAGLKAVWESCEKPLEYFDNNIVWTIKLLELMEKYSVKNIVFSSSATVYEPTNKSPLTENISTWNTTNPYWATKFIIEQILKDLSRFSGFNVINLRYFNPIWAHESWYLWEDPEWLPNNLMPFVMKVATGALEELKVFWDDYDTIDWTWIRDYIDVVDLIDWHLKAYESFCPHPNPLPKGEGMELGFFKVYNLWVGRWLSVLEMIKATEKVTWKKVKYKVVERREWDLAEVYCNPSKAEKELWWKTKVSLEDSIKNSWKFYNKNYE
jgi:UDP-glucose 4-epimerase